MCCLAQLYASPLRMAKVPKMQLNMLHYLKKHNASLESSLSQLQNPSKIENSSNVFDEQHFEIATVNLSINNNVRHVSSNELTRARKEKRQKVSDSLDTRRITLGLTTNSSKETFNCTAFSAIKGTGFIYLLKTGWLPFIYIYIYKLV